MVKILHSILTDWAIYHETHVFATVIRSFHCFKIGSYKFLAEGCSEYWLTTYCISMHPSILAPFIKNALPHSISQLDGLSDWRPGGRGFKPRRVRQHSLVEIDQEILSTVILSLPLIQEGQLSVSGERMCTILVNRLEDKPAQYTCG